MNNIVFLGLPIQSYSQKDFNVDTGYNPSLGLMALGTFMQLNGYYPTIIDLCYNDLTFMQVVELLKEKKPLLLAISVYTENIGMAKKTAARIKEILPEIKIALGGPHASLESNESINHDSIDFVIRGEGEAVILELLEAIRTNQKLVKFSQIRGLIYKDEKIVYKNGNKGYIQDLDLLPLINRNMVDIDKYKSVINIYTSKGCVGKCIYCSASALSGAKYRPRNIKNVYMEMIMLLIITENRVNKIYIVDDTFTAIPNRVNDFIDIIKKYKANIRWHCESRVDVMNEKIIKMMADAGCIAIQYGIESGSQDVLNSIQKGIDLEHAKKVVSWTYNNHILPCLSFMLGHFCDTKKTMDETVSFVDEMYHKYHAEIAVSFNTPFVGTWQYTHRDELGLKLLSTDTKLFNLLDPVVETKNFTAEDQREAFFKCAKYIGVTGRLYRKMAEVRTDGE